MRFKTLTPGYCGIHAEGSTLNSRFLGLIAGHFLTSGSSFPVTQRIPRHGFFDEISRCESPAAKLQIETYKSSVAERLIELGSELNPTPLSTEAGKLALSLTHLSRRLGNQNSIQLQFENLEQTIAWQISQFDVEVNRAVSNGEVPNFAIIEVLFKTYADDMTVNPALKIHICLRLIATAYRHARGSAPNLLSSLERAGQLLDILIKEFRPDSFSENVILAMALRALPMNRTISSALKVDLVARSIELIQAIPVANEIENVVRTELFYTTQLTMIITRAEDGASDLQLEKEFQTLIDCDPLDSTGYSELAMFRMQKGHSAGALSSLEKAIELGPPAYAMNYYYLGKLKREAGLIEAAITHWQACSDIDETAISPVIDRIDALLLLGDITAARNLKGHLLSSADLTDQLNEEDERVLAKI